MTSSAIAEPSKSPLASTYRGLLAAVAGGGALVLLSTDDGIVLCPYRRCTGGDCPLCGTTRAAGRLMRGDLAGSVSMHPMVVVWMLQVPLWAVAARRSTGPRTSWRRWGPTVLLSNLAVTCAVWLVRLVVGDVAAPTELTLPW